MSKMKEYDSGGALPTHRIRDLLHGFVKGATVKNIRPASLDLRLTDEVYRVRAGFLPSREETVLQAIKRAGGRKVRGPKVTLDRNVAYVIRLQESIDHLPGDGTYAFCNPKSSSGRVDVHVRVCVDGHSRYDEIPHSYKGPLWLFVVAKTFPVVVSPDLSLSQVRFFSRDTRFEEHDHAVEMDRESDKRIDEGLIFTPSGERVFHRDLRHSDHDGSVILTLGLEFQHPGFEAIENSEEIDLVRSGHHDPRYFFREIGLRDNSITLRAGSFYILSTREYVRVPPTLACEMRPMDERSGDLRSHYAGFIDPGWGVSSGVGRPLTLEVRSFDYAIIVLHGQPIAKIRYERMFEAPVKHYDKMNPTYGKQSGPHLAKYFSEWK